MNHSLLTLIELLDTQSYFDKNTLKKLLNAQQSLDKPAEEKLASFINAVDTAHQHSLSQALDTTSHQLKTIQKLVLLGYFVFGTVVVFGLLATQVINFFYIFVILLGFHTISLCIWLFAPKTKTPAIFDILIDKISPKDTPKKQAMTVALSTYPLHTLMHKTALSSLMGSFLALFGLFLVKSYQFSWQSTLLSEQTLQGIINIIGFLPSMLGVSLPNVSQGNAEPAQFAILILVSLLLYGALPRMLALLAGAIKPTPIPKSPFVERLLSELSQPIIDQDDFVPSPVRTYAATALTDQKIFASLEHKTPKVQDGIAVGMIDTKEELEQLKHTIQEHRLSLCLSIDGNMTADRGIVRKLESIADSAEYGLLVELGAGVHRSAWAKILDDRRIDWQ